MPFLLSLTSLLCYVISIFYAICLASLPFVKSHIVWQCLNSSCSSFVAMLHCQMNKPETICSHIHVLSSQFKDNSLCAIHMHTCNGGLHPLSLLYATQADLSTITRSLIATQKGIACILFSVNKMLKQFRMSKTRGPLSIHSSFQFLHLQRDEGNLKL